MVMKRTHKKINTSTITKTSNKHFMWTHTIELVGSVFRSVYPWVHVYVCVHGACVYSTVE